MVDPGVTGIACVVNQFALTRKLFEESRFPNPDPGKPWRKSFESNRFS